LLIKHADIVRCIKAKRIRWIEHIIYMAKESMVERITEWRPIAVRRIGRPRLKWQDDIAHMGKMKIQNCSKISMDREVRKKTAEEANTHEEL
jgi:hypothetical protein